MMHTSFVTIILERNDLLPDIRKKQDESRHIAYDI